MGMNTNMNTNMPMDTVQLEMAWRDIDKGLGTLENLKEAGITEEDDGDIAFDYLKVVKNNLEAELEKRGIANL